MHQWAIRAGRLFACFIVGTPVLESSCERDDPRAQPGMAVAAQRRRRRSAIFLREMTE
jgi:hypothetical protein